jgi:hypothetical protein
MDDVMLQRRWFSRKYVYTYTCMWLTFYSFLKFLSCFMFRYLINVEALNNDTFTIFWETLSYMKQNCGATSLFINYIYIYIYILYNAFVLHVTQTQIQCVSKLSFYSSRYNNSYGLNRSEFEIRLGWDFPHPSILATRHTQHSIWRIW